MNREEVGPSTLRSSAMRRRPGNSACVTLTSPLYMKRTATSRSRKRACGRTTIGCCVGSTS